VSRASRARARIVRASSSLTLNEIVAICITVLHGRVLVEEIKIRITLGHANRVRKIACSHRSSTFPVHLLPALTFFAVSPVSKNLPVPVPIHIGAGEVVLEHRDKFFCRNASLADDAAWSANFDFTMIGDDAPL
jgi:hypothetical protein